MGKKDHKIPKVQKKKPTGQIALVGNSDPCCVPGCCSGLYDQQTMNDYESTK